MAGIAVHGDAFAADFHVHTVFESGAFFLMAHGTVDQLQLPVVGDFLVIIEFGYVGMAINTADAVVVMDRMIEFCFINEELFTHPAVVHFSGFASGKGLVTVAGEAFGVFDVGPGNWGRRKTGDNDGQADTDR
jgi:hypothetical protein